MITNFKIFESSDFNNLDSMDVSIILEHNHIYVSVNEIFTEEDKILDQDTEKISEESLKKVLNVEDLNNIEPLKFYLTCIIFDTNRNINRYGDSNLDDKKEFLMFNFLSIPIKGFLNIISEELKDVNELIDDSDAIEDVLLYFSKDDNVNDTFYFKELWNLQSEKFRDDNRYIFDAKNFDLI